MTRLLDRLEVVTRPLLLDADAELHALGGSASPERYRRFLACAFGFVRPLELSLAKTPRLDRYFDPRRLRKHALVKRDLESLGMQSLEIELLPQYTSIPRFDNLYEALGWVYAAERTTLTHPSLFRRLAAVMPGEVAFAASYIKHCSGAVGEPWRSLGNNLNLAVTDDPEATVQIVDAARSALQHYDHWRRTFEEAAEAVTLVMMRSRARTTEHDL